MNPGREKSEKPPPPNVQSEIRLQLERILASPAFRGSKRCQEFMQFVVTQALDGDFESLKERMLATEVFGRSVGADLTDDSIVRVGAREVRKRLAQYYETDGAGDAVRIELPSGSYVPVFHLPKPPAAPGQPVAPAKPAAPPLPRTPVPAARPAAATPALRPAARSAPAPPPAAPAPTPAAAPAGARVPAAKRGPAARR